MADDDVPTQGGGAVAPGAGGSFFQRRVAGVPVWVWIVGGAAVLGAVYFLYRRRANAATQAANAQTSSTSSGQDTSPYTTIVPVDQGLANEQYQALLDALKNLQGAPSTPTTPPAGTGTVPPRVTDLHFISGTATRTSFKLAWTPVAGATDYEVHVAPMPIVNNGPYTTYHTSDSQFNITGLQPNTAYYANVLSHNTAGYGPGSNQLTNLKTLK